MQAKTLLKLSVVAAVATMTQVALPEMRKAGYDPGLSAGLIAADQGGNALAGGFSSQFTVFVPQLLRHITDVDARDLALAQCAERPPHQIGRAKRLALARILGGVLRDLRADVDRPAREHGALAEDRPQGVAVEMLDQDICAVPMAV